MSIPLNIGFTGYMPKPLDSRLVVEQFTSLGTIVVPYEGLITYAKLEQEYYQYKDGAWGVYVVGLDPLSIRSNILAEPFGSIKITNIVKISQADYDIAILNATTKVSTHYIII